MLTPNDDARLNEIADRMRRMETKVTRLLTGEGDLGVTKVEYKLEDRAGYQLSFNSGSITMHVISKVIEDEGIPPEEMIAIYDNDRYVFTVIVEE